MRSTNVYNEGERMAGNSQQCSVFFECVFHFKYFSCLKLITKAAFARGTCINIKLWKRLWQCRINNYNLKSEFINIIHVAWTSQLVQNKFSLVFIWNSFHHLADKKMFLRNNESLSDGKELDFWFNAMCRQVEKSSDAWHFCLFEKKFRIQTAHVSKSLYRKQENEGKWNS